MINNITSIKIEINKENSLDFHKEVYLFKTIISVDNKATDFYFNSNTSLEELMESIQFRLSPLLEN